MKLIEWDALKHSVNIQNFDDDHKKIFQLSNDLYEKMSIGEGASVITHILGELKMYGNKHFKEEEELMIKHSYPELQSHKEEHRIFRQEIEKLTVRLNSGDKLITVESFFFIKDWISKHVIDTDKKYVEFFQKRGIH